MVNHCFLEKEEIHKLQKSIIYDLVSMEENKGDVPAWLMDDK
jgi:hypothetical protein